MKTATTTKRLRLTITCDNAAFEDNLAEEIAGVLAEVRRSIIDDAEYDMYRNAYDSNGNVVGTFRLKDEETES